MYNEPVIWAITECRALPDNTDAELDAETNEDHWTRAPQATNRGPSHPTAGNNEAPPNHSETPQSQKEVSVESLPKTQHKGLDTLVHQDQQQNLREEFPSPKETTMPARHQPGGQAAYHSHKFHPKEGAESQPTPRTITPQEKGHPNKATGHIPRDNVQRATSNGVVANPLNHTQIQPHHQANPPGHVLKRSVPRWITWL